MKKTLREKSPKEPASPLDRLARRSALMLLAERLWRLGAALGGLGCAFLALSFAGLWLNAEPALRAVGVAAFGFVALFLVAREIWRGAPKRGAAIARLDAADVSGLRPASALEDRLAASQQPDAATATLWEAHRRRLWRALAKIAVAPPRPGTPRHDPYALRALALLAAVATGFVAGPEKGARLATAFDWRVGGPSLAATRLDAWLDPPPYTGRTALVLTEQDIGETREAPVNSILHLRHGAQAEVSGALAEIAEAAGSDPEERKFKLTGVARLVAPGGGVFAFAAIPDLPPSIEILEAPRNNLRGSMTLSYKTDDDYGVIEAQALFARPAGAPRPLFPPPQLALSLPQEPGGRGETQATLDLSDHPWAGGVATMTLKARDEGGNEGVSQPLEITLPQRHLRNPLARALAEQRRQLVFDPKSADKVVLALDALALAPELFDTSSSLYLGLRLARRGLDGNRLTDERLRDTADLLWAMALDVEGAEALESERDLRAARERLREALARGADDAEIARLTQELREAMEKFLAEQQRQPRKDQDGAQSPEGGGREIGRDELDKMLDELKDAQKSGDTRRAQALLDQLTDILENLQSGSGKGRGKGGGRADSLNELDRLSREQQQLRDETFQGAGRNGGRQGGRAAGAERQRELRERLQRQRDALRRSEQGAPSELDDADKAMKEAEQDLGPGERADKAVEAQGRALQALRKGADELARRGEGGEGEADQEGEGKEGGKAGRDPLGRALGGRGDQNTRARYDPLGAPPTLRARRVQEELRRRLGQPERSPEELDYLQRLLKR